MCIHQHDIHILTPGRPACLVSNNGSQLSTTPIPGWGSPYALTSTVFYDAPVTVTVTYGDLITSFDEYVVGKGEVPPDREGHPDPRACALLFGLVGLLLVLHFHHSPSYRLQRCVCYF